MAAKQEEGPAGAASHDPADIAPTPSAPKPGLMAASSPAVAVLPPPGLPDKILPDKKWLPEGAIVTPPPRNAAHSPAAALAAVAPSAAPPVAPPPLPSGAPVKSAAMAPATHLAAKPAKSRVRRAPLLGSADARSRLKRPRAHHAAHGLSGALNLALFAGLGLIALGFADARFGAELWRTVGAGPGTADTVAGPRPSQQASVPAPPLPTAPVIAEVPPAVPQLALPAPAVQSATQPQPAPGSPPPATEAIAAPALMVLEIEHVARFDALIAPVRDAPVSLEDATRLRDAIASASNLTQTRALRDQLREPAARTLIDWHTMRGGSGTAREIKAFADANPGWPSHDLLVQRAEEQLFVSGGSARDIKAFFDRGTPKTGIGRAALASAFLAEGDDAQAARLAAEAWRRPDIPGTLETGFLDRFGRLLTEADHKARFDRYLIDNTRWTNDRADRASIARRVLPYLSDAERRKAEARLAIYLRLPAADGLVAALPADAATAPAADWGLAFQLAQWNRRAGRLDPAFKVLLEAPTDASAPGTADDWWDERRLAAYDALKAGKADVAYAIVKSPGTLGVTAAKDQAFLAGWIALRQLKSAAAAEVHFNALEASADGPQSRARAGYWLARTYEALGARGKMQAPLERASRNLDTFYGQLARLELDPTASTIKIAPPRTPTPEEARRFNANDLVRAVVLSRKSNLDASITRALLVRLSQTLDTEAELGLLAHLAEALGDTQMAVRIGKSADARGHNLLMYAYPIHAMPTYAALRPAPEAALMLAIARQESEFNMSTASGAGARGLMQVMPITAQHVCRDYHVKCELDRIGRDPSYNAMMASAYIADRMDEFQGSYVLTIAGYNAGPGRVRQWIREFGDPRTTAIEPLDWISRIPFEETRDYVQKVLSNLQIYRARLGEERDALRLTADLKRTGPGRRAAAIGAPPTANN